MSSGEAHNGFGRMPGVSACRGDVAIRRVGSLVVSSRRMTRADDEREDVANHSRCLVAMPDDAAAAHGVCVNVASLGIDAGCHAAGPGEARCLPRDTGQMPAVADGRKAPDRSVAAEAVGLAKAEARL